MRSLCVLVLLVSAAWGGEPEISDPWDELSGEPLREALNDDVTAGFHSVGYDRAREVLFDRDDAPDVVSGTIECPYTGRLLRPNGNTNIGGFNTEHVWPQSKGPGGVSKSDLHHLYVTDASANSARSSFPFGETSCQGGACNFEEAGSRLGRDAGGRLVFDVRPAYRGDIARAIFYFSVRYDLPIDATQEKVLRAWNQADPPDAREEHRNDVIESVQGNRNPFIDWPDVADRIWDF